MLDDERVAVVRAAPLDAQALREAYPFVAPGYRMNKRHWITLRPHDEFDAQLLEDLVTESHLLVVEKMPLKTRPVDPATFGRPEQA